MRVAVISAVGASNPSEPKTTLAIAHESSRVCAKRVYSTQRFKAATENAVRSPVNAFVRFARDGLPSAILIKRIKIFSYHYSKTDI